MWGKICLHALVIMSTLPLKDHDNVIIMQDRIEVLAETIVRNEKKQKDGEWLVLDARIRREKLNTLNYKLDQEGVQDIRRFR